jgi:hypothetical protein
MVMKFLKCQMCLLAVWIDHHQFMGSPLLREFILRYLPFIMRPVLC